MRKIPVLFFMFFTCLKLSYSSDGSMDPFEVKPAKDLFLFSMKGGSYTSASQFQNTFKKEGDHVLYIDAPFENGRLMVEVEKSTQKLIHFKDYICLQEKVQQISKQSFSIYRNLNYWDLNDTNKYYLLFNKTSNLLSRLCTENNSLNISESELISFSKEADILELEIEKHRENSPILFKKIDKMEQSFQLNQIDPHFDKKIDTMITESQKEEELFKFELQKIMTEEEIRLHRLSYIYRNDLKKPSAITKHSFSIDPRTLNDTLQFFPKLIETLATKNPKGIRLYTTLHSYNELFSSGHSEFMRFYIQKKDPVISVHIDVMDSRKKIEKSTKNKIIDIFMEKSFQDAHINLESIHHKALGLQGKTNFDCHVFAKSFCYIAWTQGVEPDQLKNNELLHATMKNLIKENVISKNEIKKNNNFLKKTVTFYENTLLKLGKLYEKSKEHRATGFIEQKLYKTAALLLSSTAQSVEFIVNTTAKFSGACLKRKK